jgi:probable O-glycosylation ligase (exosortase A-associated)
VRDLAIIAFLLAILGLGLRRPFLLVLAYAYVTIVSPQRLSYYLLNSLPVVMIVAILAIASFMLFDKKRNFSLSARQVLILMLIGYAGITTLNADFPVEAQGKWEWAWKSLFWAVFLPMTLRTKLRVEAQILIMVLAASSIIIVGGIKTAVSGGGYGSLNLLVDNNSGLYEGSQISTVAIAIIPIILWLTRFGTVFPPDWRVRLFACFLIVACLLIPVGTQARTGLICIGVLAILMLRDVKRRLLYMGLVALIGAAAVPMLPQGFTNRMGTIQTHQADSSASTRIAVWAWTWDYVRENPMGGGFEAYLQNRLRVPVVASQGSGPIEVVSQRLQEDQGRAFHSSYFETLGEQGFPGLILFLLIHGIGILRMEILRRRYRGRGDGDEWIAPLAVALQSAQIIYLVGSLFVAMAYQPFIYMLLAVQIGFDAVVGQKAKKSAATTGWTKAPVAAKA